MTKYRRSHRLEKELSSAQRKIAKFEAVPRSADSEKNDFQHEVGRKVRRLKASSCCSLEIEYRLEQEICLCRDKTCGLESEMLSCSCRVTNLETTHQNLEKKKEALHQELLKTLTKNADFEIALENMQREREDLKNGKAQLSAESFEYENRIRRLESDKEFLEEELVKLCQINTLIQDKTDLSAELSEARGSAEKSGRESSHKSSAEDGNRIETVSKHYFIPVTQSETSTDKTRKLYEVATDLETKYNTCKTELEKQRALIKAIVAREEDAARATREAARDLQLQLDASRMEIQKRDVMMKTLREDKRSLERNIQEFNQRNYQQKCDSCNTELDLERTLGATDGIRIRVAIVRLQDSAGKYQQATEVIAQDPHRQKTVSPGYNNRHNTIEQKATTLLYKGKKTIDEDYAKHELDCCGNLSARKSLPEDRSGRERVIFRGYLPNKRQEVCAPGQFHASVESANGSSNLELNSGYESKYRESCHERYALKTLAAEERKAPSAKMENDLDPRSAEYNNKQEEFQREVEGIRSKNDSVETPKGFLSHEAHNLKQAQSVVAVSNGGYEMASSTVDNEFTNGHASPESGKDGNDSFGNVVAATSDFQSLKTRKEELQQLCEVLMEERNNATGLLKERDDEVMRLRMRSVGTEHEKSDLKIQLSRALSRSDLLEKELASVKDENEELKAEVARLRRRIEELEAENTDLKWKLRAHFDQDHANEKKASTADLESAFKVTYAADVESAPTPIEENDVSKRQEEEYPSYVEATRKTEDGAKSMADAARESAPAVSEVVKRRENRRTAPNYYRHSFAGSLPRPFQSFDVQSQHSLDHTSKHERSESIHSDTSGDSELENHAPLNGPSFIRLRRKVDKPYFKSSFSPVQFNYQPLPESISSKRESWLEGVARARGDSLSRAHENSSDSESSGRGSSVSATAERSSQGDAMGNETYGLSLQLRSQSPDVATQAENARNSTEDLPSASTHSTHEDGKNVSSDATQLLQSDDQSQVDGAEQEKTEHVSDLVNMWNNKTEVVEI